MYQLRGTRVVPIQLDEIRFRSLGFCYVFDTRSNGNSPDKIFEQLTVYGITLSVKSDNEWEKLTYMLTEGHCDTDTLTITVPNSTYKKACKGDYDALFTIFHEIGHLILTHKATLHRSHIPPEQNEDSEWQADMFAGFVLKFIGYTGGEQMSLNFDK